jgi:ribosomal-protein-alanine N-acetyltransferase
MDSSPPLPFEIHTASWRDVGELRTLEQECFAQDAWPLIELLASLTMPGLVRLKAVCDNQMVGFVGADAERENHLGWITTIGVRPAWRRRGIGRALLAAAETAMAQPRVRLCVRKSNAGAVDMYLQEGYQPVDLWKSYYIGGEDALVMEKNRSSVTEDKKQA